MALPNKILGETKAERDPKVVEREVDILIVGGGRSEERRVGKECQ